MTVRVRIAPSPTGYLHIGNARSALFNWLYARHTGGVFIVRIDDTDRGRSTREYEEDVLAGLRWLGLDWDEGVEVGGPHGTYRQSDRLERYQQVVAELVASRRAYPCFCTPEELAERREEAQRQGRPPGYDGRCRLLEPETAAARAAAGEPASVRLAVPRPGETTFDDVVRGEMRFGHEVLDDFVILRSDGSPTYHLASTVDDVDYRITHVARGEDLLSSTPRHILLTEAMGEPSPIYAHLPLLFGPDGRKLSKRHGDTALRAYIEGGYLADAMFNYLGLLGWSYDAETTIFSRRQAVERFELADVSKNPAVFDVDKLQWMNGEYVRAAAVDQFAAAARPFLERGLGRALEEGEWDRFRSIAPLVQERVKLLQEVPGMVGFLYREEVDYDEASWKKVMKPDLAPQVLEEARARLSAVEPWDHRGIEETLRAMLADLGIGAGKGLQPIRVAVTGTSVSPPLFESLEALGRQRTLARLVAAAGRL